MLAPTTSRVARHTSEQVNEEICRQTETNVRQHFGRGPRAISWRLDALDREWDIERLLEANAASLTVLGVVLGATVDRRFFAIPGIVGGFLLQHALQGWCPPVPLFRRLGFRTEQEIQEERYALKALRGDFEGIPNGSVDAAMEAVRLC